MDASLNRCQKFYTSENRPFGAYLDDFELRIVELSGVGHTIRRTAELAECSESQVKRIWADHKTSI